MALRKMPTDNVRRSKVDFRWLAECDQRKSF